jgi:hypothetical protein
VPPLLAGAVEKLDDLRDFFRDYDDRRVEELREYLVSSDIWTEEPRVLRPSLTFISRYGESPLVRVGGLGLEPVVLTPQRLNEQAVGLSGSAIIRVGRVAEFRQRTSDSLDYMYEEVRLVDREGGNVWGGIGSVFAPERRAWRRRHFPGCSCSVWAHRGGCQPIASGILRGPVGSGLPGSRRRIPRGSLLAAGPCFYPRRADYRTRVRLTATALPSTYQVKVASVGSGRVFTVSVSLALEFQEKPLIVRRRQRVLRVFNR